MRKNIIAATILFALLSSPVFSQTAEKLDPILDAERLTAGQAAYIAAASSGLIDGNESNSEALQALVERGLSGDTDSGDRTVRLDEFARMLMLSFDRDGGLLYKLFPGPRYALRELEFERVVQGGGDPAQPVSGQRAIRLSGRLRQIASEEN